MANPKHLEILERGVDDWNMWRLVSEEKPNLMGAHLDGANLEGADLRDADLRDADLTEADLNHAKLGCVDFTDTILEGADLSWANALEARFTRSYLGGTNLANFFMGYSAICDVDLTHPVGLEAIHHRGPCSIGTDTLRRTASSLGKDRSRQGEVETFLRRTGVDEEILGYFRLMISKPIEFYSCFISYSHKDKPFARRIHDSLQERGIRCWLDEKDLRPGDPILDIVNQAIRQHDKVLLCCSRTSLTSRWVDAEIASAFEEERKNNTHMLIPLDIDGYLLEAWDGPKSPLITSRLAADFTGWESDNTKFEEQFEKVMVALRADGGGREEPPEKKL